MIDATTKLELTQMELMVLRRYIGQIRIAEVQTDDDVVELRKVFDKMKQSALFFKAQGSLDL